MTELFTFEVVVKNVTDGQTDEQTDKLTNDEKFNIDYLSILFMELSMVLWYALLSILFMEQSMVLWYYGTMRALLLRPEVGFGPNA